MWFAREEIAEKPDGPFRTRPAAPDCRHVAALHRDDQIRPCDVFRAETARLVVPEIHAQLASGATRERLGGVAIAGLEPGRTELQTAVSQQPDVAGQAARGGRKGLLLGLAGTASRRCLRVCPLLSPFVSGSWRCFPISEPLPSQSSVGGM